MPTQLSIHRCGRSQAILITFMVVLAVWCCSQPNHVWAKEEFYILLPININEADAVTLSRALTGVGPKKAAAIIAYREAHGEFQSVHELLQVKGIGPGTLAKNRSRIILE